MRQATDSPVCIPAALSIHPPAYLATVGKQVYFRPSLQLEGEQFCPQPAFSRLWPPKKAAAAKIGRPPRRRLAASRRQAALDLYTVESLW
jgi:hypothetical protein